LLQPTSPFRSRDTLVHGIELFRANQHRTVIGVAPAKSHPMWCFKAEGTKLHPFVGGAGLQQRSQDLAPAYSVNGAFYLIAPRDLRKMHSFYNEEMQPLVIDRPEESIDIDSEWDWEIAEALLRSRASSTPGAH
jgi:CMP-N,N'-diacetyllegionaminic acid synthase